MADGTGAQVKLGSATITTSGSGSFGLIAGDSTSSGHAGSISATGTLNVTTTNPAAAAVALQGNGAAISATGGGTITSAGQAIAFLGGTGQTATFDNFNINNVSGDLIFADPSIGTVNFNGTTANAGSSNLLDATNFSAITLNANASTLTGAIRSDPTSTTNVNLNNGTTWTVTGPSTVTNLSVANSIVVFAPPGSGQAFKTLTVTNYVGSGVEHHDECRDRRCLIGRRPDHRQRRERNRPHLLTIRKVGSPGGQTSGSGIPLVVATNGGSSRSTPSRSPTHPSSGAFATCSTSPTTPSISLQLRPRRSPG